MFAHSNCAPLPRCGLPVQPAATSWLRFSCFCQPFEEDEDVSGSVLQFLAIYYSLKYISFQFIFSPYLS